MTHITENPLTDSTATYSTSSTGTHQCRDCMNYVESTNGLVCFCFYWLTFDLKPNSTCDMFKQNTKGYIAGHRPPAIIEMLIQSYEEKNK